MSSSHHPSLACVIPQSTCEEVRRRKEVAMVSKVKAEGDYANARTQQEAERAERAIKEAILNLKV